MRRIAGVPFEAVAHQGSWPAQETLEFRRRRLIA
jgi:hypothetical protein